MMSTGWRRCSSYERVALDAGWELCALAPGAAENPAALSSQTLNWHAAQVPGTAASSLQAAGLWNLDTPRVFDAEDWWFRVRFKAPAHRPGDKVLLHFGGIATVAQVWLNGQSILESDNMFHSHLIDVGTLLTADNELLLCCRALEPLLRARRPRPRWRTPMVEQQQLRWIRTTLLGRTPGWSPPCAPVGPWRGVWLEHRRAIDLHSTHLSAQLSATGQGVVSFTGEITELAGSRMKSATLLVASADAPDSPVAQCALQQDGPMWAGTVTVAQPERWWPHTHGKPARYPASLKIDLGSEEVRVELGYIGFRRLQLQRDGGDFALRVNDEAIFCRGACWMPTDAVGLQASAADHRVVFEQIRDAGMNMLRVCGPTVYESDEFLDLCDEYGVLLWQDFMFANMDYPADDAHFRDSIEREAEQQLARLQSRPALAMLCGNSEVAQQASMAGAARELWAPPLFESILADLAQRWCPAVPYCPSSTHGGAFPHQVSEGVTSYYGVGAYLRPPIDARVSQLRFASEALAFANVPERETLDELAGSSALRVHHPRWKQRVPRDLGAGWDFDDVRDHYLTQLYGVQPLAVRYADHERYLRLSRVASAEVMAAAFGEWRRAGSLCRGALVWFLRDLWAGAGWGVIDAAGRPKAAYYALRRTLQPLWLHVADEGNNGLVLHMGNEGVGSRSLTLEVGLHRWSDPVGVPWRREVQIPARGVLALPVMDLAEGFLDLSYAFRFGPASYDVLVANLWSSGEVGAADKAPLAQAFYFPLGAPQGVTNDLGLTAVATALGEGALSVTVSTRKFAQAVHIDALGYIAEDQYFHLAPGSTRTVRLLPQAAPPARFSVLVQAMNAATPIRVTISA